MLSSLERLLAEGERIAHTELFQRQQEWKGAQLSTPHGQPVASRRKQRRISGSTPIANTAGTTTYKTFQNSKIMIA